MKNTLTLISLIALLILGPSACGLLQSCPEALPFFQIEGLDLIHYRFDNDSYGDQLAPNATTPWQDYGLRTDFKTTYYGSLNESAGGSVLYALSCVEDGYMGTEFGVDTLYLVALGNYNAQYAENDTLNEILVFNDYFDGDMFYSLEEYLLINRENVRSESLTIKLTEGPSEDTTLDFELIYILKSGTEFKQKSSSVSLRK